MVKRSKLVNPWHFNIILKGTASYSYPRKSKKAFVWEAQKGRHFPFPVLLGKSFELQGHVQFNFTIFFHQVVHFFSWRIRAVILDIYGYLICITVICMIIPWISMAFCSFPRPCSLCFTRNPAQAQFPGAPGWVVRELSRQPLRVKFKKSWPESSKSDPWWPTRWPIRWSINPMIFGLVVDLPLWKRKSMGRMTSHRLWTKNWKCSKPPTSIHIIVHPEIVAFFFRIFLWMPIQQKNYSHR